METLSNILHTVQKYKYAIYHIVGLVQERHNSTANALELHLSHNNPSICNIILKSQDYIYGVWKDKIGSTKNHFRWKIRI